MKTMIAGILAAVFSVAMATMPALASDDYDYKLQKLERGYDHEMAEATRDYDKAVSKYQRKAARDPEYYYEDFGRDMAKAGREYREETAEAEHDYAKGLRKLQERAACRPHHVEVFSSGPWWRGGYVSDGPAICPPPPRRGAVNVWTPWAGVHVGW